MFIIVFGFDGLLKIQYSFMHSLLIICCVLMHRWWGAKCFAVNITVFSGGNIHMNSLTIDVFFCCLHNIMSMTCHLPVIGLQF